VAEVREEKGFKGIRGKIPSIFWILDRFL